MNYDPLPKSNYIPILGRWWLWVHVQLTSGPDFPPVLSIDFKNFAKTSPKISDLPVFSHHLKILDDFSQIFPTPPALAKTGSGLPKTAPSSPAASAVARANSHPASRLFPSFSPGIDEKFKRKPLETMGNDSPNHSFNMFFKGRFSQRKQSDFCWVLVTFRDN